MAHIWASTHQELTGREWYKTFWLAKQKNLKATDRRFIFLYLQKREESQFDATVVSVDNFQEI